MADMEVMRAYAGLVAEAEVRERIFEMITTEFERTRQMLELVYGGPLSERRPNIHAMTQLRRDALRTLHQRQIELLRQWRTMRQQDNQAAATLLLPHLLLTVNALASGLGSTG
jgi:phosphoenolpyruvate carboxylase